jgi:drug/metabolite transporter (DMT)-like permease
MVTSTSQTTTALRWATMAMILSAVCWATGTVMSKYTLETVPPLSLLVVQLSASVVALWTAVLFTHSLPPRSLLKHGWTGILEPGLAYIAGLIGLVHTSASSASLLGATEPFVVLILAFFLLRERLPRRKLPLIALALTGTLLVSFEQGADGSTFYGDFIYFLGVGFAALYVIISRKSVAHLEPLPLAALQQSFGLLIAFIALPIGLSFGEMSQLGSVPLTAWGIAALTGIIQYALAFFFYLSALKTLPVTRAALFLTLIPIFGIGGSALFLGEQMTVVQLIGAACILGALLGLRVREE